MGTGAAAVGELSAHPVAVLAIPAFVPVVGIVLTVLWIARQDRRAAAQEADPDPRPGSTSTRRRRPAALGATASPASSSATTTSVATSPQLALSPPDCQSWVSTPIVRVLDIRPAR